MRLAGTGGGAAELRSCAAPLPSRSHSRPCPHPWWVSQPQDGQHLEVCATAPETESSQRQGPGPSSHQRKLGHAVSPGVGSSAASPQRGPSSHPALGQGCGWGALLSLQHPSPGWGAIALIRVISLAQLRSSSRLESVRAAHWFPGNWGAVSLWQFGQPGGVPLPGEPLGMRGRRMPTAWTGMGTSPGQRDSRTCPRARQGQGRGLETPHPSPAQPQTGVPGPSQHLWVLHPRLVLPGVFPPKTHALFWGSSPLPPAPAASDHPFLGTRLLPQLGAGGAENDPHPQCCSIKPQAAAPAPGTGAMLHLAGGVGVEQGPVGARWAPTAAAGG